MDLQELVLELIKYPEDEGASGGLEEAPSWNNRKSQLRIDESSIACSPNRDESEGDLCERISGILASRVDSLDKNRGDNDSACSENGDDDVEFLRTKTKRNRASLSSIIEGEGNNLRSILGDLSSNQISRLTSTLTDCMSQRVDAEDLMPQTMDTQANEAVMAGNAPAITLTKTSLSAATVYAQMATLPGSLGSGLIQMQSLSALVALLKRWKTEIAATSAGRLAGSPTNQGPSNKNNKKRNNARKKTQKRLPQDSSKGFGRISKRSRGATVQDDDDDDDDDDNYAEGPGEDEGFNDERTSIVVLDEGESDLLDSRQLAIQGLRLAKEVAVLPVQREFMSWSEEARESIIEATALILAVSAALQATNKRKNSDGAWIDLAIRVEQAASESLEQCTIVDHGAGSSDNNDHLTKRHETIVTILRGLHTPISMKDELPNGEMGRQLAATCASRVLTSLVQELRDDISVNKHRWPASMQDTPHDTPSQDSDIPMAVTPKSSRKTARLSFAAAPTLSTGSRTGVEMATPPRIKGGSKTPFTAPRTVQFAPSTKKRHSSFKNLNQTNKPPRLVLSALVGILQKLVTDKTLERAVARTSAITAAHKCLEHLPGQERMHFLKFLIQMSYSKVPVHRLVAAELMGLILAEPWLWAGSSTNIQTAATSFFGWTEEHASAQRRNSLTPLVHKSTSNMPAALFGALQGRLCDKAPTVRTAAIAAFTKVLRDIPKGESAQCRGLNERLLGILSDEMISLAHSLRVRASLDEKSLVRKAAIEALVEVLVLAETSESTSPMRSLLADDDINILVQSCKDNSVMTRKAGAEGFTYLLEQSVGSFEGTESLEGIASLLSAWTSSVLPMVLDSELGVSSKAVELVNRAVLRPLLQGDSESTATRVSWYIFATLGGGHGRTRVSRIEPEAMRKALAGILENEPALLKTLMQLICSIANDKEIADHLIIAGAWSLCNALVNTPNVLKDIPSIVKRHKMDLSFLGGAWEEFLDASSNLPHSNVRSLAFIRGSLYHSMHVMAKLAPCVDAELAETTKNRMLELLTTFTIPPEGVGPAVSALVSLTIASHPGSTADEHKNACTTWIQMLFRASEEELRICFDGFPVEIQVQSVVRALCTSGEVAMVGFSPTEEDGVATKEDRKASAKGSSGVEIVIGLRVFPPKTLVDLVRLCMAQFRPGPGKQSTPRIVRAHAFLTFGRLCLRDSSLAKGAPNILARELHQNMAAGCPTIQSNALLIIGDLCVRYTNLVDRYLPVMAACLQSGITDMSTNILTAPVSSGFAPVRKSAVILLSNLIMQDYIKWRGLLFHRFLVATTDEDDEVSEIAEAILSGPLALKQPKLFASHFVEAFFVLNCCSAHPIYQAAASAGDGGSGIAVGFDGISLKGEAGKARRHRMYELMLSKMNDQEKLEATGRITKEILGGALVEGSELFQASKNKNVTTESAFAVLSDALFVLQNRNIRVGRSSRSGGGEEQEPAVDVEDPNMLANPGRRKAAAMGKLLSNISRKHMIESVLPVICQLKAVLQKHCSPLLKDLMAFIVEIFRLYKNEVHEFLANDPDLLREIEYDTRRYQKERQQRETLSSSTPPIAETLEIEAN